MCVYHLFYFKYNFKCHEIVGENRDGMKWENNILSLPYKELTKMKKLWTGSQDSGFLSDSIKMILCHLATAVMEMSGL